MSNTYIYIYIYIYIDIMQLPKVSRQSVHWFWKISFFPDHATISATIPATTCLCVVLNRTSSSVWKQSNRIPRLWVLVSIRWSDPYPRIVLTWYWLVQSWYWLGIVFTRSCRSFCWGVSTELCVCKQTCIYL